MHDRPIPCRQAPVPATLAGLLAVVALAGCSLPGTTSSAAPPSVAGTPPTASIGESRPVLPAGFPVMPGAAAATLPSDPTVIARWTVDELGSAAYDFYAAALPTGGYPIVGRYPAERSALIRFTAPRGSVWQLVAEQVGNGTQITVQTDRP